MVVWFIVTHAHLDVDDDDDDDVVTQCLPRINQTVSQVMSFVEC